MGNDGTLKVTVHRGSALTESHYQTYEVPTRTNQTVLDVVTWIQRHADPTLTYRFACRVGMCGSCAMMVNGIPRWTCRTHVSRVTRSGRLTLDPLRNLPIIKDLAADLDTFFDKWSQAGGRHRPTRTRRDPIARVDPASPSRQAADAAIECINCAVCHAACDTVAASPRYLGPAPLQRAWTLVNDEKCDARAAILTQATAPGGCLDCHSIGSCTRYCPNELDPMSSIAGLKRKAARSALRVTERD